MSDALDRPPLSTPRLDAIRAPLPGAPAGIDLAYEDDFQSLKADVDALGSATGGVDYGTIADKASAILETRSKDLTVACYLAFALPRVAGYAGLAEGAAAVRAVAEGFWDDAFPPLRRMRARQSAMQFMIERTTAWAEPERPTPADRESLEQALAELTALQAFTTEAMADDAPAFSGLTRVLREALRSLPEPAPPAPEPPPAEAAPAGDVPPAAASVTVDAEIGSVSDAQSAVFRAASYLREQSAFDPTAAQLVRAVRWGELVDLPPTDGGRTLLPAPPPHQREAFASMLGAGQFEVLATAGEDLFQEPPYHFWLDLQRYIATALGQIGATAAHAAVTDATAGLVRRLPALATLAFDDGTPFADATTAAWLAEIAASGGGGAPPARSPLDVALADARAQAGAGDVPGAVAALVGGAGAPRDRFERGVAAAELCLAAGRPDVALALLDDADEAIRAHRLDVWDPSAARSALQLLHAASTALLEGVLPEERYAALRARADDAFARLARIDPGLAMRVAGGDA